MMSPSLNSAETQESIPLQRAPGLVMVNDTPKGRGVFATNPIPRNTTIDISPVLIFTPDEVDNHTIHTTLAHYTFTWPSRTKSGPPSQAIALGLGSMFNHSRVHQNVVWTRDLGREVIVYSACRHIEVGEELCISYGDRLWFEDVEGNCREDHDDDDDDYGGNGEVDELGRSGLGAIELVDDTGNVNKDQGESEKIMEENGKLGGG